MPTDGSQKPDLTSTDARLDDAQDTVHTPDAVEPSPGQEHQKTPRIPVDLVGGIALLGIAAVFLLNAGDDPLDWIFPLSLGYALASIAVYLVIRGLLGFGDKTDTLLPVLRGRGIDAFVFTIFAAIYVGLLRVVGFWTMSMLMLIAASVYLDPTRSKRRIALAAVVALAVCVGAYVLLVWVLHVPLPRERWLPS